jgi:hypothetical protein
VEEEAGVDVVLKPSNVLQMAGGVGTRRPFALNTKCLIVSGVLGAGYWFLPRKNWFVLGGVVMGSYIALAWYDELYDCDDRLKVGALTPLTKWAKPTVDPERQTYGRGRRY